MSILFAHTGNLVGSDCAADPQGVTLTTIGAEMAARGQRPTGTVVTGWVGRCMAGVSLQPVPKYIQVPDWTSLQGMYAAGWTFIPHSRTYPDVTSLSLKQQQGEICGSRQDLVAHDLLGGRSVFAYPNNLLTSATQAVLRTCGYLAGRKYGNGVNTLQSLTTSRLVSTVSVNGGWCNNSLLPCYSFSGTMVQYRYTSPAILASKVAAVGAGHWAVLQFYRPITGSGPDGDCTSTDWHDHWTVGTEYYCWNDLQSVLAAVPPTTPVVPPLVAEQALGLTTWG